MQFKYYNILWVFLGITILVFIFMPSREDARDSPSDEEKRIPQSQKNGPISSYTDEGLLKTKVNYVKGVKNGISYLYYSDGKAVLLEMPYVNGKREGISKKYYETGKIYAKTSYTNDQLNGLRTLYYSSGTIKAEIPYRDSNPGIGLKEYLTNGKLKNENEIKIDISNNSIYLGTTLPCKELIFYIGKLMDDQFFDSMSDDILLLSKIGSQYYIDMDVYNAIYLKYQDIICSCKTRQGNPQILKRRIDASSLKNVNQ